MNLVPQKILMSIATNYSRQPLSLILRGVDTVFVPMCISLGADLGLNQTTVLGHRAVRSVPLALSEIL